MSQSQSRLQASQGNAVASSQGYKKLTKILQILNLILDLQRIAAIILQQTTIALPGQVIDANA